MALARFLAYCSHPTAAWRLMSKRGRVLLLGAYFSGGYAVTLALLWMVSAASTEVISIFCTRNRMSP